MIVLFQVFVSLRQNDQELASMYDQVILNKCILGIIFCFHTLMQYSWHVIHPAAFSAESHGQPQKLYGWSDGRGESCPRGQNFGEIQPEVEIKFLEHFNKWKERQLMNINISLNDLMTIPRHLGQTTI